MARALRIGVDLGGTKIEALAMDGGGEALLRRRIPTPRGTYAEVLDAIAGLVLQIEEESGVRGTVGVATPGAQSPATGRIKNSNSRSLNDRALDRDLAQRLGREVRLANDADCFALSEAVDGAAADARVVFGVIVGTGTGGGVVVDGRLLAGPNAIAGEWGHNPLPWTVPGELPGPDCYCGKRGCIETFLSGPGMARDYAAETGGNCTAREIVARARDGHAGAGVVLERYIDRMARSLATVINVLDPDVIVLGGGLSNIDRLYAEVPRRWGEYVFSDRVDTRLVRAVHGDAGGVRGAAWLWSV